ncbi:MAG: hypothetical protein ABR529_13050 [Actinomycetota bacterium]
MSSADRSWQAGLQGAARTIGAGLWAGLISGFLWGGVGGRLAMFVLRLTSDPSLRGLETDDGFIIGRFSSETGFLVLFTTALGGLGGLFYLAVRPWLPQRYRPAVMAVIGAAVGGALVIRPEGIDFTLLAPLSLAIAMFLALPALYGAVMSALAERFLAESSGARRGAWIASLLPLAGFAIAGVFGLVLVGALAALWALDRRLPLAELWCSRPMTWVGRAALALAVVVASVALTGDVAEVLR